MHLSTVQAGGHDGPGQVREAPAGAGRQQLPDRGRGRRGEVESVYSVQYSINRRSCTITEKAPTRAFTWLKAAATTFTYMTPIRLSLYDLCICIQAVAAFNQEKEGPRPPP